MGLVPPGLSPPAWASLHAQSLILQPLDHLSSHFLPEPQQLASLDGFSLLFLDLCLAVGGAGTSGLNVRPECQVLDMENPPSSLGFLMIRMQSGFHTRVLGSEEIVDVGWCRGKWGSTKAGLPGHRGSCLNSETLFPNCERIVVLRGFPELLPRHTGLQAPSVQARLWDLVVPVHHEAYR